MSKSNKEDSDGLKSKSLGKIVRFLILWMLGGGFFGLVIATLNVVFWRGTFSSPVGDPAFYFASTVGICCLIGTYIAGCILIQPLKNSQNQNKEKS